LYSGELSWGIIGRMGEILGGVASQRKRTGVGGGGGKYSSGPGNRCPGVLS
jgi:hypothetical protein